MWFRLISIATKKRLQRDKGNPHPMAKLPLLKSTIKGFSLNSGGNFPTTGKNLIKQPFRS